VIAVTVHLSGSGAVLAVLVLCGIACIPVWVVSIAARDWAQTRIEASFRRRMVEQGVSPGEIDEAWREIVGRPE